jgi:stage II sporulation protein R
MGVLTVKRKQRATYLVVGALIIFLAVLNTYMHKNVHKTGHEYIRFHVIANSDSPEDQALKLKVRDRLLERFGREFASVDSIEDGRRRIQGNIAEIEKIAMDEIKNQGQSYSVKVQFGNFSFPTRAYGQLVLPAGEYEALKVVIGKGSGANWWCVMFPPLCFVDISYGVVSKQQQGEVIAGYRKTAEGKAVEEKADGILKYDKAASHIVGHGKAPDNHLAHTGHVANQEDEVNNRVEYRWKIIEWLKGSKMKMERVFSFLSIDDTK